MFGFIKNGAVKLFNKGKELFFAGAVGVSTMAITFTGGLVEFEEADKAVLDKGIGNSISNLWAGFKFVLPYIGTFVGIALVIGGVYLLVKKARS